MISVAMCTYNGSRYIDEQLSSIRSQTRMPDELVVCDDGSSDETVAKLQDFARNAPFPVRVLVSEMNVGTTRNFEKAIALCEGDLIVLSDQDDIWVKSRLQRTEGVFAQDQSVGLIFGDADIIHQDSSSSSLRLWSAGSFSRVQRFQFRHAKAIQALLNHNVVTGATMAFRSAFREVVLPIPDIWVHDGWVALIISFFSNIAALSEPLIRYRKHPNQQFGPLVEKMAFSQQLSTAKTFQRWQYERQLRQYEAAYDRLIPHAKTERQKRALQCINGKIVHLSARARMPERKIKRVPVILKELATMRYTRYSRGLMSAAKDLLLA
jgi:glycosyltransferase involved in cell wall biosynthesis